MSKFQVLYQTTNTILKVNADTNDKFIVRAGAMVATVSYTHLYDNS